MKRILLYCSLLTLFALPAIGQKVISMKVDGAINPVTAGFIHDGIQKAAKENASCLVIHLNTPGGLVKSTRVIVTDILESPVPVIVYVSPGGAHSGSAGVFITLAAHIAAMAPGTNIGAAHPVSLGGAVDSTMNAKITNDAAAFIRSIAEKRHRNIEWAENAVRKSFSYSETEALEDSAIDLIAKNELDLLNQIDGRQVELNSGTTALQTKGATVEEYRMGFIEKLLDIISDPNIAYILLLVGFYGILFELYNPGAIFPGVAGGISLILAFYAMHTLPVNYAGVALIVFAFILFILEIKIVSHGILAIGGVLSLLLGSLMLIKTVPGMEMMRISRVVIVTATAVSALFFLLVIGAGIKAQRGKSVTGADAMIGHTGEVTETLQPTGMIRVLGELWSAESLSGVIGIGEKVRIREMKNLKLFVEAIS